MFHLHSQDKMFHVLWQVAAILQCKFHCGICSELQNVGVKTAFRISSPTLFVYFRNIFQWTCFEFKIEVRFLQFPFC